MDRKSIVLLVLLWISSYSVIHAQKRNPSVAEKIAKEKLASLTGSIEEVLLDINNEKVIKARRKDATNERPFYIYNNLEKPSFVIVSGDERMKTILGFSEDRIFDGEDIPCGLSYLLSYYAKQYEILDEINCGIRVDNSNNAPKSKIGPLLNSKWGQESPYNDNCPPDCPSGCIATAMSQIMYYYMYPNTGRGMFSYTTKSGHYCSFNFEQANFDWQAMQGEYNGNENIKSRSAVASLMEASGVSVGMEYNSGGSGGYETSIPYALINFFRYNPNVVVYERDYYKSDEWYEMVFEELTNNRPILYCGTSPGSYGRDAGHAFVIDGYSPSDEKFHVNWGWDGRYDAYYELDALNPPNGYRFATNQSMIARFYPENIGTNEDVLYAESFDYDGKIEVDKQLQFKLVGVYNFSNSSSYVIPNTYFSGIIGVGLFNSDNTLVQSLSETEVDEVKTYWGYDKISFPVTVPSSLLTEGEFFYIAPFAMSRHSNLPTRIRTIGGLTDFYLVSKDGDLEPTDDDKPEEKEILMEEDFESGEIASGWSQNQVSGAGKWIGRMVYMGNDNSSTPFAASGKSYIYLDYNSGTIMANVRTITKLVTPVLSGEAAQKYALTLHCRKYSRYEGTKDIISVMIDRNCNNQWEILSEQSVDNINKWMERQITYVANGKYRIAIEGNIEYGTSLFVDNIKVARVESATNIEATKVESGEGKQVYSLSGQKLRNPRKGLNIIRKVDGTTKKIIIN